MAEPRPQTILVVDDEPRILELARRLLEPGGYRVLVAGSATEALALVDRPDARIDLLIADVVLPGMSGPALARRVMQRIPRVRLVYLSGFAEQSGGNLDLTDLGVTDGVAFLGKPFTGAALTEAVREALAS